MAPPKKLPRTLPAIDAEMSSLKARQAELRRARKTALDAQKDAGRDTLLTALSRIAIAPHSKDEARRIARAIETHGPAEVARRLSA